jgi:hypothetical protein
MGAWSRSPPTFPTLRRWRRRRRSSSANSRLSSNGFSERIPRSRSAGGLRLSETFATLREVGSSMGDVQEQVPSDGKSEVGAGLRQATQ